MKRILIMNLNKERAQPLESVKTKYLAVSPVTDNSEQLIKDVNGGSQHANFKIKFVNKQH